MMEFATASEKMESVPNVSEPYVDGETIDAGASFKTSPGTLMLSKGMYFNPDDPDFLHGDVSTG